MTISVAVIVILTLLVVAGVWARRASATAGAPQVTLGKSGLAWIYVGVTLTVTVLAISLIWTVQVLAKIDSPVGPTALTLEVTGRQWWWEVRYRFSRADQTFVTANEIHIPVGEPVLVKLTSADVIHSFWVPALSGKTDTIPGRTNIAWLQADRAGVYLGQCTEYCGEEHAKMALRVIADRPAQFDVWRAHQLAPAVQAEGQSGAAIFQARCAACHTVRGAAAGGIVGPDLTHLMSRQTLASGILPNNEAALAGWISNPQALKPGSKMPATHLSGPDLGAVTAYLETLK
jgi:cytochrome c oxidase subunit 2